MSKNLAKKSAVTRVEICDKYTERNIAIHIIQNLQYFLLVLLYVVQYFYQMYRTGHFSVTISVRKDLLRT